MRQADLLVYSIGAAHGSLPSYVYVGGYLEADDFREIDRQHLVGDIATVFFRENGSFNNIALNARASGPDLSLVQRAKYTVCIVSGLGKVNGLRAALQGKLMRELIVDEPTAHASVARIDRWRRKRKHGFRADPFSLAANESSIIITQVTLPVGERDHDWRLRKSG